ncbi:IS3 family transposase, partial [Staphylococcus aureus]|uniref:IS3 family transposase n=1 Tax=Staphylococcus aureus TaxID=1280 RepID=UPI00211AAE6F
MANHCFEFSVKKMCQVLEVSKIGYYKWSNRDPSSQQRRKEALQEQLTFHFHDNNKRYGSPKITQKLMQDGYTVSERTVTAYMNELGLRSCVTKNTRVCTTDSNHDEPIDPNTLNQTFTTTAPNKVWAPDITYIPCREGRLYLACVLDLYTKEIVGWQLAPRMTKDLVLDALTFAYEAKQPENGLLYHSDRGTQYASKEHRELLSHYHMEASM